MQKQLSAGGGAPTDGAGTNGPLNKKEKKSSYPKSTLICQLTWKIIQNNININVKHKIRKLLEKK